MVKALGPESFPIGGLRSVDYEENSIRGERSRYLRDEIDIEEFERRVERILAGEVERPLFDQPDLDYIYR